MTAEEARADYAYHIRRAEVHGHGLTDTTPYRAVLDDPLPTSAASLGERPAYRVTGALPAAGVPTRGGRR